MGGPLEGVRVLDFTWALAGPYATMILADLGAEVIKVEIPGSGDMSRKWPPYYGSTDVSHYFFSINRGKKGLTLNLKSERGKEIARRLIAQADILVENMVPGTMAKLGLGYEDVKDLNPRLIYASCSGFGHDGPYRDRPAFDIIVQAMAGTMSVTGEKGRPPVRVGFSIGDIAGGMYTAVGVLAALVERERSGLGQYLDISLMDSQVAMLEGAFARYFASGQVPTRNGSRHPILAPFQAYPTSDGEFVVGVGNDRQWDAFCRALGLTHLLEEEKYRTVGDRMEHVDELEEEIAARTRTMTTAECLAALSAACVPNAPVQTIAQAANDPQVNHREMLVDVEHKRAGKVRIVGTPIKMSRSQPRVRRPAPDLGEHSAAVLSELLGMDEQEIAQLREQGVI